MIDGKSLSFKLSDTYWKLISILSINNIYLIEWRKYYELICPKMLYSKCGFGFNNKDSDQHPRN